MDGENKGSKPYEPMDDVGEKNTLFLGWHPFTVHERPRNFDRDESGWKLLIRKNDRFCFFPDAISKASFVKGL